MTWEKQPEGHGNRHNNKPLTNKSQKLRKEMTKEERHLWYDFLKGLPVTVLRYSDYDVNRDFSGV